MWFGGGQKKCRRRLSDELRRSRDGGIGEGLHSYEQSLAIAWPRDPHLAHVVQVEPLDGGERGEAIGDEDRTKIADVVSASPRLHRPSLFCLHKMISLRRTSHGLRTLRHSYIITAKVGTNLA
jgi:hypothetical protein